MWAVDDPWWGILAPAKTDAAIVRKINADVGDILRSKPMTDFLASQGAAPLIESPDEFLAMLKRDVDTWAKVIKEFNKRFPNVQVLVDRSYGARVVEAVSSFAETNRAADYAKSAIPARFAVERSAWRDAARLADPAMSKFPYTGAIRIFARALGAARSGDVESAARDLARLDEIEAALKVAKDDYWATEVHVQQLAADVGLGLDDLGLPVGADRLTVGYRVAHHPLVVRSSRGKDRHDQARVLLLPRLDVGVQNLAGFGLRRHRQASSLTSDRVSGASYCERLITRL